MIAARVAQGYEELKNSTPEERQDIIERWNQAQSQAKKWWSKPKISANSSDEDVDRAIKESVAATSKGDKDQDQLIQRALKASVDELRQASAEGDEDEAMNRAIRASIEEANKFKGEKGQDHDEAFDRQIALAIQQSLGLDNPDIESDDDENMKAAIAQSREADPDLDAAIKKSLDDTNSQEEKAQEEERIVMEYVKKQSLIEEEHRKAQGK
jgi:hypothetical protein